MTLDDVRAMERATITPDIAARVIGCDPHYIRIAAREHPDWLGFPVVRSGKEGHRTRIPRLAFIRFMEGEHAERQQEGA